MQIGYIEVTAKMASTLITIGSDPAHKDAAKVALEFLSRRGPEVWKPAAHKIEDVTKPKTEGRVIDSSKLSYEDRQQLRDILMRNLEPGEAESIDGEEEKPEGEDDDIQS